MPTSVMPKGVEHYQQLSLQGGQDQMPTSVMPKGVEHPVRSAHRAPPAAMPTSVMPKGVEHLERFPATLELRPYAHLCDAERR